MSFFGALFGILTGLSFPSRYDPARLSTAVTRHEWHELKQKT
jgi:hypothetical protein